MEPGREWRGGQHQVRLLARALHAEPAIRQRLVTRRGSELARRSVDDGVTVRAVPWAVGLDPRAWWCLVSEMREFPPDVIHAHNSHALSLALWARHAIPRQRRARPPVVLTRRVAFPLRRGSTVLRADRVIAISEAVRATLIAAGVPPARIALVSSGIDPEDVRRAAAFPLGIRARLGLPGTAPVAANVAALEPGKDHATLLRAAARALPQRPDLHWVIAGAGPLRRALAAEVRRLGLADRVHLIGWTDHPEALMREADVVVMSSRTEGLGTVVLDALSLGKPVVATRGGGLAEILPAECLVGVGDAARLGDTVVGALDRPCLVALPSRYTAAAMAQGVLTVYRALPSLDCAS